MAHSGNVVISGDGYDVIDCETCGFKHVTPLPDKLENETLYRDSHYDDGERDRLNYYERDRDWWLMSYRDVLSEIAQFISPNDDNTLVDIGCGAGLFLEAAKEEGWNTVGVEISTIAANHCRDKGLDIINSSFDADLTSLPENIKVVHMRNILEHVPDPFSLINVAFDKLASGGVLVVGVPNDFNPLQEGLRKTQDYKPWWVAVPHHLNYFDFDSLEALVSKCGFNPLSRFSSFPLDLFLAMGDNYIETPNVGRECHLKRVNFEWFMENAGLSHLRQDIYRAFSNLNLGREAIVIAQKP